MVSRGMARMSATVVAAASREGAESPVRNPATSRMRLSRVRRASMAVLYGLKESMRVSDSRWWPKDLVESLVLVSLRAG